MERNGIESSLGHHNVGTFSPSVYVNVGPIATQNNIRRKAHTMACRRRRWFLLHIFSQSLQVQGGAEWGMNVENISSI